jgi:hypothetical protein
LVEHLRLELAYLREMRSRRVDHLIWPADGARGLGHPFSYRLAMSFSNFVEFLSPFGKRICGCREGLSRVA